MKRIVLICAAALASAAAASAQDLLVCDSFSDRVLLLNGVTGSALNANFIVDGGPSGAYDLQTPREALQVAPLIWVLDQDADAIFRFDSSGAYHSTLAPGIDDARGLALHDGVIYVANNGTNNGAPGRAVLRLSMSGAVLGSFPVGSTALNDIADVNGELLIADTSGNKLDRYSYSGAFLGSVSGLGTPALTSPKAVYPIANGELLVAAPNGIYKLDSSFSLLQFSGWSFWSVGAVGLLGNGQYVLTGPSGLGLLNPNNGGFSFLVLPGGVVPQLISPFDSGAPCSTQVAYCTAGTTTNGCTPSISAIGSPSVGSAFGYVINVTAVEGQQQGLIFYGANGRAANPWGASSSFMCIKSPVERMNVANSGGTAGACDGVFSQDWRAFLAANPLALGNPLSVGAVFEAQGWFRDPPSPKTTNLSDALEFTVCP